ncbi:hypothetical protein OUZ56_006765 [Daphnia magna]|uniref:Uncharacterized protein n=1 Tax=Daphnia magna TaxID=35525 RepID=A0ABQ9YWN6_9CRUS|nr:hypothetical protein OUZ56_006765 [Daphnia magna]
MSVPSSCFLATDFNGFPFCLQLSVRDNSSSISHLIRAVFHVDGSPSSSSYIRKHEAELGFYRCATGIAYKELHVPAEVLGH